MKILHTSDWHLGQVLMGKSRASEHRAFLEWLIDVIDDVDLVIVAGDIFDLATPSVEAQTLYYDFLGKLIQKGKRALVIAGNHDSVHLLESSKNLVTPFGIDIVTRQGELIDYGEIQIAAVPFLRERYLMKMIDEYSLQNLEDAYLQAIVQHYQELIQKANSSKPLLATGHLSLLGARQSGSEREIYIGNLASLSASFFSEHFAYTALGHFHTFQEVAPNVFYSGSAIPLNFKEAKEQKYILVHDTHSQTTQKIPIPLFRPLVTVKSQEELQNVPKDAWVEVVLENESFIDTSGYEVLAIKKPSCKQKKSIKNFSPQELFASLVSKEADKEELQKLFEKILQEVELGHEDY